MTNEQSDESDSPKPPPPSGEPTLTSQAAEDYRSQIDQSTDFQVRDSQAGAPQTRDAQTRDARTRDGQAHHDQTSTRPLASRLVRRSGSDRYVGGVLGGVADRFGLDSSILRIGIVAATLFLRLRFGPYALPIGLYVLMWLTLPTPPTADTSDRALLMQLQRRAAAQEVAVAIVSFFAALLALESGDNLGALLLGAIAVVLLASRRGPTKYQAATSPADPLSNDAAPKSPENAPGDRDDVQPNRKPGLAALQSRMPFKAQTGQPKTGVELSESLTTASTFDGSTTAVSTGGGYSARRPKRELREPALWPLTFSLLVLGALAAVIADRLLEPGLDPGIIVNGAALIIGAVLALSWWRGRARVTVIWLLLLTPAWIGLSFVDTQRYAGAGSTSHRPQERPESGELRYELGYGSLQVDLRKMDLEPGSVTTVEVNATAGQAVVWVPDSAILKVEAELGFGGLAVNSPEDWQGRTIIADAYSHTFRQWERSCDLRWLGQDQLLDSSFQVHNDPDALRYYTETGARHWDSRAYYEPLNLAEAGRLETWLGVPAAEVTDFLTQQGFDIADHDTDDSYEEWLVSVDYNGWPCLAAETTEERQEPPIIIVRPSVGLGTIDIYHG